jgi:hypothetical protein
MSNETPSNVLDMNSPTANMFGIQPCPKCKSVYRYLPKQPDGKWVIRCDNCGFEEDAEVRHDG